MHRRWRPRASLGTALCLGSMCITLVPYALAQETAPPPVPVVLSTPGSVRSAGIRGTGAALVGYAGAVFSNPAGIATIRHVGLEGGYRRLLDAGYLATGALAWRIRQFDLGFGVGYLDFGRDPSALLGPTVPAGSDARELTTIGSVVYRFGMIALGGSGKYVSRAVDETRVRAFTADAGLAVAFFDIMAIGFAIQNLGGNWREDSPLVLPRLTRLGFTMNYVDPQETFRLLSTLEMQWEEGLGSRLIMGGEAGIVGRPVGVVGRVGYGSRPSGSLLSDVTYGATLMLGRQLQFDYAYQDVDLAETASHRFGLRLAL